MLLLWLALLSPWLLHAQEQSLFRTISWQSAPPSVDNGTEAGLLYFEGATYLGTDKLPSYTENFFDADIPDHAMIDKCIFAPLTKDEYTFVKASGDSIPVRLKYNTSPLSSRRQQGVGLRLFPFIRDTLSGQVRKLVSFRIVMSGKAQIAKQLSATYANHSVLSSGNWYKLAVTQTGVYRLTYSDLQAMGINMAGIDPLKIGIFGRGGTMLPEPNSALRPDDLPECAILVTGAQDGKFDSGDQIIFYAQGPVTWNYNPASDMWEHTTHLYSDTICYFLTTDRGSGKRIVARQNVAAPETDMVNSFADVAFYQEHNLNLLKSGRQWFSQSFDVVLNKSYAFDVPPLHAGGNVKFKVVTAAKSLIRSTFQFAVGPQSFTASLAPVTGYADSPVATGNTTYSILQGVTLPLRLNVAYNKVSPEAAGYLDLIDVNAECDLKFGGGQFDFRDNTLLGSGHIIKYTIGDAAGKASVWDVSDPLNITEVSASAEGSNLVFTYMAGTARQFIAFDDSKYLKPGFVQKVQNQDLHAFAGADMLILAPPIFMEQAVRLATFHASFSDMNVQVLDPAIIYNEFSSGTADITAIRDFLKMLYDKSPSVNMPEYLLLFGDASYDYKYKIPGNTNFIPSWQSPESYNPVSSLVSDDYYGMLDENEGQWYTDVIDLGIGRLPVKTATEAAQVVDKIIHYSTPSADNMGDWRNVITFVADDEDQNDHMAQAEQMATNIDGSYPDFNLEKIYLDAYVQIATPQGNRYPDVNQAITQRIEKGSLIVNYTGHGGETGWAHEEVLTVNEINNWSNFNSLPVFVTATCEFSRFDDPERTSAGEYVLLNPKGGGIALFTTTRPTYGTPNFELNKAFYQYALAKPAGKRLKMGDIIMKSKRDKGANENGRKYVLLGDPALTIDFPSYSVITTAINGHAPANNPDTLKAYMEVHVEGFVADTQGHLAAGFDGTLVASVFDKPVTLKTLANDGGVPFTFSIRKNIIYKGKVIVSKGKFSFTFIVPKDIAYSYGYGKISYYASNGQSDAAGSYSNIIVGGSQDQAVADNNGPVVKLYMNNPDFKDGGITDQNPRLLAVITDQNGINTIGNGIGHDITAVLDGVTSEPFILNDFYQSDINTFKSGYIWFPFSMLPEGEHSITLKVWDIFNNSTEAVIHFVVTFAGEFVLSRSYNVPNPFNDFTNIVFEHNQQYAGFTTRAEIYSITGQLVRVIEQTSPQNGFVSIPLRWDGLNSSGSRVLPGLYVYHLYIRTTDGLSAQTSGKMILQK